MRASRAVLKAGGVGVGVGVAAALVALAVTTIGATGAATPPPANRIAPGTFHTCAITADGRVKCWGRNADGVLGFGIRSDGGSYSVAVTVRGVKGGVHAVTSGHNHTCVLTRAGGVKCWGDRAWGQLGDGSDDRWTPAPVDVSGLRSGVASVRAGHAHTCALTRSGGVKCWGQNSYGELGNGIPNPGTRTVFSAVPVGVVGLSSGVREIDAGTDVTCAVLEAGGIRCWGQVLDTFAPGKVSSTPVSVPGISGVVKQLALGNLHACVLTTQNGVKCWGSTSTGAVGNGVVGGVKVSVPVDVVGLTRGVTAIAAGHNHSCALTEAGGVKCWGDNTNGQLGNGIPNPGTRTLWVGVPVDVLGLSSGVVAIAAGFAHTCAWLSTGVLKCWGHNDFGQLGNGVANPGTIRANYKSSTPQDVLRFAPRTIILRASRIGALARGTAVTFTANALAEGPAMIRFEIHEQIRGRSRLAATRTVNSDPSGRGSVVWTFPSSGTWIVRAKVLANGPFVASPFSQSIRYTVR